MMLILLTPCKFLIYQRPDEPENKECFQIGIIVLRYPQKLPLITSDGIVNELVLMTNSVSPDLNLSS